METMAHLRRFSGRFVFPHRYSGERISLSCLSRKMILCLQNTHASHAAGLRSSPVALDLPPAVPLGEGIIVKLIGNTSRVGSNFAKLVMKRMDWKFSFRNFQSSPRMRTVSARRKCPQIMLKIKNDLKEARSRFLTSLGHYVLTSESRIVSHDRIGTASRSCQ